MNNEPVLSVNRPVASWVWNVASYVVDPDHMLRFCRKNGVTDLYYAIIPSVTDLSYAGLLRKTGAQKIQPAALLGDASWILPIGKEGYIAEIERVGRINSLCGEGVGFAALHFDVEPYVEQITALLGDEGFEGRFVALVEDARRRADELGLRLEWDIPAWYGEYIDPVAGTSVAETMFRLCDRVTVMDYRDTPEAQIEWALPNAALSKKHRTPMLIGCETLNVDEARRPDGNSAVSYYEEGKRYLYHSMKKVEAAVRTVTDDFGFAIHDIMRWMDLSAEVLPQYAEEYGRCD